MENAPNTPFAGEVTQEPDLFSLVDLRLIEGEGHWIPIVDGADGTHPAMVECYNKCHGEEDGRFCEGDGDSGRDAGRGDGELSGKMEAPLRGEIPDQYFEEYDFPSDPESSYRDWKWKQDVHDLGVWDGKLDEDPGLKEAHQGYFDRPGSVELNNFYRSKDMGIDTRLPSGNIPGGYGPDYLANMDRLFEEKAVPAEGITLFRGTGSGVNYDALVPGSVHRDGGYLSASTNAGTAHQFLEQRQSDQGKGIGAIWAIKTEKDTKLVPGNPQVTIDMRQKNEYLLNRGGTGLGLKINTIASDLKTRNLIINAEVVE